MQKLILPALAILLFSGMSCKKNKETEVVSQMFSVYLTDNPADLEKVNIDIHSVEVKVDEDIRADEQQIAQWDSHRSNDSLGAPGGTLWHGGIPVGNGNQFGTWVSLDFAPGIYDILKLRNGIDMLLGSVQTKGVVRKIRIALGSNSHVVKKGVKFPLQLADDSLNHHIYIDVLKESRIKNIDGSTAVYLDFDLGRSIYEREDGYVLNPNLRTLPADRSLELEGYAFPVAASVVVSVYNDKDTATALPDDNGYFKIRGLELGRYSVRYDAGNRAYRDTTTIFDITKNKVTLPAMTLKKY